MRIDGVTTPPGLITAGKTWTLASAADGFWMVHVGWQVPGEPVTSRPTIFSGVDADDLTAVAADRRARFVPWSSIRSVRIRLRPSASGEPYPIARLRGRVMTRRLDFRQSDREAVEVFFEPVSDRVG